MFFIKSFYEPDFSTLWQHPDLHCMSDNWTLKSGVTEALVTLPTFDPTAIEQWTGFQILPLEANIRVSLLSTLVNQVYWYDGNNWIIAAHGESSTPDQIRQGMEKWVGPITFRLHLKRDASGRSPFFNEVKVGYAANGTPLGYCLQHGLPRLLAIPIELYRLERTTADGTELVIPGKLDHTRIQAVKAWRIRRQPQNGTIIQTAKGPRVQLDSPIPGSDVLHVKYLYVPKVEYHPSSYQITDVPCARLIVHKAQHRRRMDAQDFVKTSATTGTYWETLYLCHRAVDVAVLAASFEEAFSIASQMEAKINATGFVNIPTLGLKIGVSVTTGADLAIDPEKLEKALLYTVNFQLLLRDLPEGNTSGPFAFNALGEDLPTFGPTDPITL